MIVEIKENIVLIYDILATDIPHEEMQKVMTLTSTKELILDLDNNFYKDFKDKPIRKAIMTALGWFLFQFVRYKVQRYKQKFPEYLL